MFSGPGEGDHSPSRCHVSKWGVLAVQGRGSSHSTFTALSPAPRSFPPGDHQGALPGPPHSTLRPPVQSLLLGSWGSGEGRWSPWGQWRRSLDCFWLGAWKAGQPAWLRPSRWRQKSWHCYWWSCCHNNNWLRLHCWSSWTSVWGPKLNSV